MSTVRVDMHLVALKCEMRSGQPILTAGTIGMIRCLRRCVVVPSWIPASELANLPWCERVCHLTVCGMPLKRSLVKEVLGNDRSG